MKISDIELPTYYQKVGYLVFFESNDFVDAVQNIMPKYIAQTDDINLAIDITIDYLKGYNLAKEEINDTTEADYSKLINESFKNNRR